MGFGKGSSSSAPVVTEEQKELLRAQTGFLTGTALPEYQKTIGMAGDVYGQVNPAATTAANTALGVSGRAGALQEQSGSQAYLQGLNSLSSLFSPEYKNQQIQASLQPAREEIREQMGQQAALFGGAGGMGSSRQALASRNLASLGEQRMGSVAAQTSAGIESQRQRAAESFLGAGERGLSAAQQSAASRIGFAGAPQDVLSKYASVIYGTPQASTTPSFQGTQGATSSGKGFNVSAPKWG
jgi:hypothetical protein